MSADVVSTKLAASRHTRAEHPWRSAVVAVLAYLFSVVAANTTSTQWPPLVVGDLLIPTGTVFAGVSLTARDLVHDALGVRGVAAVIATGTGLSAVFATPQIAVASAVAFTASEVVDSLVYSRLRQRTRLGAVAVSNAVGLVVDSVLFVPLAFGGIAAIPGQVVGKSVVTVLTLAGLHIVCVMKRRVERS